MAEDMIGTLFESDATSILDSEASNLLTELESMATTDPGQPPPPQQPQQNRFYDYGAGGGVPAQPMQSPASQAIQSPVGSLHSPGALISPSTSHFGSPPPQQANPLQRQMSAPHQYTSYPTQSMQQGVPSPGASGPLWRTSGGQPGYPSPSGPPQSPQRAVAPAYNMPAQQTPAQHGGHMPPPGQLPQQMPSQQYMAHPGQVPAQTAKPHPSHPSTAGPVPHDPYRHMQPHPQQQMQYRQMAPYMHQGMGAQHMGASHPQHMVSQQPRMPRPGVAPYNSAVMHQRMPHMSMMGPPAGGQMVPPPSGPSAESPMHAQHPQQQQAYRHPPHYQQQMAQQHAEMLPPGHYQSMNAMRGQMGQQGTTTPYSYSMQQPMPAAANQAAYSMPQSSPHIPMASNHPSAQNNSSSLEQLEKMVSPLNQQPGQQQMPSSPMSAGYPSQAPMLSPRAQHVGHPLAPQQDMSPVRPHMMSPQHPGTPQGSLPPVHPQMHSQQQYGVSAALPQSHLTPLETIANDISTVERKLNQLKCHPPPYHPEHEKELRALEERLRSLNSQQTMMLDDVKHAQQKDTDKSGGEGSTGSAVQEPGSVPSTSQPSPSLSLADMKPSTDSCSMSEQAGDPKPPSPSTASQLLPDDSEELSAALSAIVDSEDLSDSLAPPQLPNLSSETNTESSSTKNTNGAQDVPNVPAESTQAPADAVSAKSELPLANTKPSVGSGGSEALQAPPTAKVEKKAKAKKSKEKSSKSSKKKNKGGAEQLMSMPGIGMPVHPHGHQVMSTMHHGLPPPPHQAMMQQSQAMMQPIAPHPHSTSQPIMFVQSQSGAPMILQQPPGMPSQPNMSGPMLTSPPPAMPPYQQAPVGAGHPPMRMHLGMQPNPQPGAGQQLRPIAPRPSLHSAPHPSTNMQVTQNGPSSIASASSTHLPELLEDPEFKISSKGSSFPGSIGETVDSPALSEASSSTLGKAKKSSGKSSKSSSRKGKKAGPKKPPASLLKLKKRKRKNSDSQSDAELSPGIAHTPDSDSYGQRRSGRVTKRQKYIDDLHLGISDDENRLGEDDSGVIMQSQGTQEDALVLNQYIVEKIMGTREGVRELEPDDADAEVPPGVSKEGEKEGEGEKKDAVQAPVQTVKITEYYVKYKNFSYLHCDWRTQEELEVTDKRINQKIKRWQQKQSQTQSYMMNLMDEDELFNPEYVEVDRVLGENHIPPPEGSDEPESIYYLIKWRQLPYEDATWELEPHVDKAMVARYKQYVNPPESYKRLPMPTPTEWKEIPKNKLYKGDNLLREYQFEGVNWLTFCYYNRRNCILADEMGLGKTVQSIAYLQAVFDYGIRGPFLVIAPLSTIGNWIREFDTWTDLNVIVYHGSSTSRAMIQEYDMFYKDSAGQRRFDVFKFNCLITTYEVIIQDVELLTQIEWRVCVIDEAHRLKNKNCKLMEGLRCFELEHKVLLSGTPLQNNVEELYSLLHFLEPEQFKSSVEFMTEFGNLQTQGQVHKLKAVLKPMMLRRLKEDVEKNLAPKEETIIEVELTNIQKKYYRAILEKNFQFLSKGGTTANVPNLMNTMMELRKCCNHPYLIDGAEEKIVMDMSERRQSLDGDALAESMVHASGKLVLLDKLLPKLKAGNHKVLIFSQMIRVLDIIEDYLINRKYIYERIDGRIRGNQRQEAIDRFSRPDSDRFVFLLCTRAGGLGINLTAADTCVIYDSDWNPQNDLQAQARCHRIGQTKAVKIYRLICKNTYEREMFDKASLKLGLDKAVLQSMGSNKGETTTANGQAPLSKQEVEQLLKKGAYGALMEDDKAGDQFCEEDIDQILQRRTQVITIESVGAGSTFAKASFSSAGARDDIDINDPEFWQKWAKKAEVETENVKSNLIIAEPRQRKQTKRFGGHGNAQLEEISDLDSSSDSEADDKKLQIKPVKGRKGRGRKDDDFEIDDNAPPPGCYARPECFKVEKMLLVYGWGRWTDIVRHGGFRRGLDELDVSNISQAILLYSLQHYKGDATIKTFIWDLVMPSENGETKDIKNHQGLAAPTPRGRKQRSRGPGGKKDFEDSLMDVGTPGSAQSEISCVDEKMLNCPINTEMVLSDAGYRKHLIKHSNKVLLRVRMLYYLKQEIIGAQESKVFANTNWSQVDISPVPKCDGEPPATWWDKDSDKCLLIGVFKHGYEKYNLMRADSSLLFLAVCGPPDGKALRKEQLNEDDDGDKLDDVPNDDDPATPTANHSAAVCSPSAEDQATATQHLPFPSSSDLNTRIRRIISTYQKMSRRKAEAAMVAQEKKNARMERNAAVRMRDMDRVEKKNARWTRREESDFYRVISSFGVESTRRGTSEQRKRYVWDTFRQLANLHKKDDEMLTDYYESFCFMCRRVCGKLTPLDEVKLPTIAVEPISEERANRCLSRIELLNKIREEVLWHECLTKRLTMCQYSPDIPSWWKPGEHDKDLLIGAAKHGLAHTDQHILYDSKLCFKDLYLKTVTEPDRLKSSTSHTNQDPHQSSTNSASSQSSHASIAADNLQPVKAQPSSADPVKAEKTTPLVNGDLHHSKSDVDEELEPPVKMEEEKSSDDVAPEQSENESADSTVKQEGDDSVSEPKPEATVSRAVKMEEGDSVAVDNPEDCKPSEIEEQQEDVKHEHVQEGDDKKSLVKNNGLPAADEPSTQFVWPKDRVIYQRLELVCYCIETGEWPTAVVLRKIGGMGLSNALDTPVGTPDASRVGTPNHSDYSCAMEDEEMEGLRLTISRGGSGKARKPKKSRLDLEVDRIARLRDGGESECSQSTPLRGTPDSFMNGSMSSMNLSTEDFLNSFAAPRKKRGRKSKAEKEAEARAAMEQTISASYRALADLDVDQNTRIPMIDTTDGSRLVGDEAPMFKDLTLWRCEHPQYMVSTTDLGASSSSSQGGLANFSSSSSERKGRRSKHESSAEISEAQFASLTGSESVTVIHRETGKKITGSKAPSLLLLQAWLEKNTQYDVDPKWSTVVRHLLPEHLKGRVYSDKKKRRREEASSSAASASSSSMAQAQAAAATQAMLAAAMQSYPMNLGAFGSLASMGMPPSMMSLYGLGMGAEAADDETVKAMAAAAASTSAHSAFPFNMYNPLFTYSSMLAAQGLGMNASQGYAQALSSAGMLNGLLGLDPTAALAASGAGMELDADMAEKLAAITSANMMEEMQARSKAMEEYSRAVAASGLVPEAAASKEPGETSPHTASKHRKSATVTKSSSADDEMPEDLSIKPRGDGDSASLPLSADGRLSRESELREGSLSKLSEGAEERSAATSSVVDKCATSADAFGEQTVVPEGKRSKTPEVSSSPPPPLQGHLSPQGHSNSSDKSRPESRS